MRAAASSIASGIPSSLRQIWTMAATDGLSAVKVGSTASARLMKSRTASLSRALSLLGSDSDGTCHMASPVTPSPSRLVASTVGFGHDRSRAVTRRATAPIRCSQLSSTRSSCRSRKKVDEEFGRGSVLAARREIPRAGGDPKCVADSIDDHLGIAHRGKFGEPGAAPEVGQRLRSSLERQPSLAGTTHAGQSQQAMVRKSFDHFAQFLFTADERSGRGAPTPAACRPRIPPTIGSILLRR